MIIPTDCTGFDLTGSTSTVSGCYESGTTTTVTYSYSVAYYNIKVDKSFMDKLLRLDHLRMIRQGWNNPQVIGIERKPILVGQKMVIRNQLLRRVKFESDI